MQFFLLAAAALLVTFSAIGASAQAGTKTSAPSSMDMPTGRRPAPLMVGEVAPAFTLPDDNGNTVSLAIALKSAPVVLVFYRGDWCPFCARQLAGYRSILKPGENVRLYAISVDDPKTSKAFAQKLGADGKGAFNFPILSDREHKTIDAYGIYNPAYVGTPYDGIPYPAVFVLDQAGTVRWAKVERDYKQRPSAEEVRTAIDALK
jgi:peroxiredoxin